MKNKLFVHDMIHHNPGLVEYESKYADPSFLKTRGYDAKVFDLFHCAQFGLLWDGVDEVMNGEKIFPLESPERQWALQKKAELYEDYSEVKKQGLDVYFMMDMIVLPQRIKELYPDILNEEGKIDILRPRTLRILEFMFHEMFHEFPQIDGIYIRYGETYAGNRFHTPYHSGNNPIQGDMWEYHEKLMHFLINKVCVQYDKKIMYRTWGFGDLQFDRETYLELSNKIPVHKNFYFCIKHTAGDFHRTFRFNQCLNAGMHQQVVEIQAAREYEGKGAYPNYIGDGLINGFEEYAWLMKACENKCLGDIIGEKSLVKGIWTWSRGGGWDGPYINGKNGENGSVEVKNGSELWADINAYVISRWAKNPSKTDRDYVLQYAGEELGMGRKDACTFYDICIKSARAVLLGRGTNTDAFKTDVFWTRDQNIDYGRILNILHSAIENDALEILLYEKAESVTLWKEMVVLANELDDDCNMKPYIITTCQYGYCLFSIYECIFRGNGYALLGGRQRQVQEMVAVYDALWDKWKELKKKSEGCPTLFVKENSRLDMIGYDWNTGMDAAIEPLRDLDDNGFLKEKYLPCGVELTQWGLIG